MKHRQAKEAASRMVGVPEAAEYLGLSPHTIRAFAYSGRLASHKLSTRLLFSLSDLDHLIASSRRPAKEEAPV